jgi:hypothetical protein
LKPEWWSEPLVHEKYQGKGCLIGGGGGGGGDGGILLWMKRLLL